MRPHLTPMNAVEKSINIVYTISNQGEDTAMSAKIQKWGNSLGVRIPKSIIEKSSLQENSEVDIESKNGTIVIRPVEKEFSLDELLDQITDENLHKEDDLIPMGKEVW